MRRPFVEDFLSHRYLLWSLSLHDFRSQYFDSLLGSCWALIKPLVMIGIYVLVFTSVVQPGPELRDVNFGLYVFAGMLSWLSIQESFLRGATVMQDFAHLVRHHPIPLYILPFHLVLSATVSGFLAILVFMLLRFVIEGALTYHFLLMVFVLPVQVIFCFGLVLLLSVVTVFVRDTQHFIMAMLTIWFFASPIVFPREALPVFLQSAWSNPLVGLTAIYRDLLLIGRVPSWDVVLSFSFYSFTSLFAGLMLYGRTKEEIIDWV